MSGTTPLSSRVAFVTGGSGGIGRALVERLAGAGCDVGLTYAGGADRAEEAAERARALGARVVVAKADLTDPASGLAALEQVEAELGPVDVLVPNAGLSRPHGKLEDVTLADWRDTFAVNTEAPFLLAQRAVPAMAERGFGRVLFVSSVAAYIGGKIGPHYSSSKAALGGLVAWLAARYAKHGVTVNAIAPAMIQGTEMFVGDPTRPAPIPVGRFGTPDETADLALALLTNGYLTAQTVLLDGGLHPH